VVSPIPETLIGTSAKRKTPIVKKPAPKIINLPNRHILYNPKKKKLQPFSTIFLPDRKKFMLKTGAIRFFQRVSIFPPGEEAL
jgi:hypothetical protein